MILNISNWFKIGVFNYFGQQVLTNINLTNIFWWLGICGGDVKAHDGPVLCYLDSEMPKGELMKHGNQREPIGERWSFFTYCHIYWY